MKNRKPPAPPSSRAAPKSPETPAIPANPPRAARQGPAKVAPTRDEILAFIRGSETPVGKREIARAFGLKGAERIELKRALRELRDGGDVVRGKQRAFAPPEALPEVGVVEIAAVDVDGTLIGRPAKHDDEAGDAPRIELSAASLPRGEAAPGPGDRFLCYLKRRGEDVYEARAIRKVGSAARRTLGVYSEPDGRGGMGLVSPTDRKLRREFDIAPRDRNGAEPGDLVWIEPAGGALSRRARVAERIGSMREPRTVSLIAIATNDIPVEFSETALAQARDSGPAPIGDRLDLRRLPFVTIDGEDARDFDDAVLAEADTDPGNAGGWRLMVAIADVAWYVRPGDPLDRAASRRGNSVYFPDRVVPMLPEELSNGWCSLRPREDRPVLVADMRIDAEGGLLSHRFHRAAIRSAARLTYTRVQDARDGRPDDELGPLMAGVIGPLFGAYAALDRARRARGALDLDLPERTVRLGSDGLIAEIGVRERLDSHKLIEEFMILANVAAAEALEKRRQPCMYRVHDQPDPQKLEALRDFLSTLGVGMPPGPRLRPAELNRVLAHVAGAPHQRLVNETVLRSQSQAVYAPDNIGHFGLALARYAHFTSPIRRYADLLVHRALITGFGFGEGGLPAGAGEDFAEIGTAISACERRAIAAERGAMDRYMALHMADRVGAEFDGRINGVTRFGLFVTLDGTGADGLIPIRALGADFFRHDERAQMLVGDRSGVRFRLGDRLRVRLQSADVPTGSLVFELVSRHGEDGGPARPGGARTGQRRPLSGPPRQGPPGKGPYRGKTGRR